MASEHRVLYPDIEPYRTGRLQVGGVHEIYFEESGNPNGKPVVGSVYLTVHTTK